MNETTFASGIAGGKHLSGMPLTTETAREGAPDLMRNAIDKAVTKIRPMATPLDQISRLGHVRSVDALEVDYYSVDTRKDRCRLSSIREEASDDEEQRTLTIKVSEPELFEPSETVAVMKDGETCLRAYITGKDSEKITLVSSDFSPLPEGGNLECVRMGRAATQLDVQSPQFSVLPTKNTNYCQIFKMQVEQSIVMKLSHKEIGWDFDDQEQAAVYDMRAGMEKQFLFGKKMKVYDPVKHEKVTLTEGIWTQAGKEINIDLNALDSNGLIDMLRECFTGNGSSRKKVLLAGADLISALNKLEHTKVITATDQQTVWGIDFSVMQSKFGRLHVAYSDVFDTMGMPACGIVIDPEYIQKHVFIPFRRDVLDLRKSGQRNTEAAVFTEASCLTLRYPEAHARIVGSV